MEKAASYIQVRLERLFALCLAGQSRG